jgi:hypothetical protein
MAAAPIDSQTPPHQTNFEFGRAGTGHRAGARPAEGFPAAGRELSLLGCTKGQVFEQLREKKIGEKPPIFKIEGDGGREGDERRATERPRGEIIA